MSWGKLSGGFGVCRVVHCWVLRDRAGFCPVVVCFWLCVGVGGRGWGWSGVLSGSVPGRSYRLPVRADLSGLVGVGGVWWRSWWGGCLVGG